MAITVNWNTQVINVPQADLTLVGGNLYELDVDSFRLSLKDLEDGEGMPFLDTHRHNTQVTIAGTTFSRTVEIINGYSVEFEDGQYSVRLSGANNNIFDVESGILVQNQVQVIPNNSAGAVVVETGVSGLTASESSQLALIDTVQNLVDELHKLQGLDASNPMTVTRTSRVVGDIEQKIEGNGETISKVTRL